jgi:hypothetical protein
MWPANMLTLFTTAKPFQGHNGIIQRNALKSWTLLDRDVEVIVFGDDEGSAEVCAELGIRHEPVVERNESGTLLVNEMFARVQAIARHDVLCYVNCDIILMADFRHAIEQVRSVHAQFLMVGRRWDTDITQPIDFSSPNWEKNTRQHALTANRQRDGLWIDYFAFSRGLYGRDMPPFAIGRTAWDDWLVWKGCQSGHPVVNASPDVLAVHQNHDYGHHPQGTEGIWRGEEAKRNFQLMGGLEHRGTIDGATMVLKAGRLRRNHRRHWLRFKSHAENPHREAMRVLTFKVWLPTWHSFLGLTRPLRRLLGLTSEALQRLRGKV